MTPHPRTFRAMPVASHWRAIPHSGAGNSSTSMRFAVSPANFDEGIFHKSGPAGGVGHGLAAAHGGSPQSMAFGSSGSRARAADSCRRRIWVKKSAVVRRNQKVKCAKFAIIH